MNAVSLPEAEPEETAPSALEVEPGRVAVTGADGGVSTVPSNQFQDAVAQGYRPATRREYDTANTTADTYAAAALGAGRGFVPGYDAAVIKGAELFGVDRNAAREVLEYTRETNTKASMGGEVVGSLAQMALLPGGGASAEVTATSMLGRAAQRAVSVLPRAAMEGAAMGLQSQLTEDTLGGHEIAAENYVAAGLKGGALGMLLAGGLTVGGGAALDAAKKAGGKLIDKLGGLGSKAEGAAVAGGERGTLATRAAAEAEVQAAKSVLPSASMFGSEVQRLGRTAEEQTARARGIGRRLLDEGIVTGEASQATIASRLTKRVGEVGEELGAIRKGLEKATARPSMGSIQDRVLNEVLLPLDAMPGTQSEMKVVTDYVTDLAEKAGEKPSFEKLFEFRAALDKKLDPKLWAKTGTPTPAAEQLGQVRRIMEEEFEAAAERAGTELGQDVSQKYALAKAAYSDLKTAEKWVTKAVAKSTQNRAVSLTDTIAGAGGMATAVLSGNPLPLLAPFANKLMRERGNQFAASVLDRTSKLRAVQQAGATVEQRMADGTRAFLRGEKRAAKPALELDDKATAETVRMVRGAASNPAALQARITQSLGDLHAAAPQTARAAAVTLTRAAMHFDKVLPKERPAAAVSLTGAQEAQPMTRLEIQRAKPVLEVLRDPVSVTDALAEGRISREHVEALRDIFPQLYAKAQQNVRDLAAEDGADLSEQQRVALSMLFGVSVSAQMKPSIVRGFQEAFTAASQQQQPAPGRKIPLQGQATSKASGFDRVEEGS